MPSVSSVDNSKTSSTLDDITNGLGGLGISGGKSGTTAAKGERRATTTVVDFVSPTLLAEEEVVLACGVTLKFKAKTKLDKESLAWWLRLTPESSRRS